MVGAATPRVPVSFDYDDESDPGPYPFDASTPIEGGSDAGGDRHALMLDRDSCLLYELYDAHAGPGGATAGSGAIWDLRSNALRPAGWTSADAAGLPILPGLLRWDEVAAGSVQHALRFTVHATDRSYVWPATHSAGARRDPALPPMGARFRLRAGVDLSGFRPDTRAVLVAMQRYGLIVADNGSDWYVSGEATNAWPDAFIREMKSVPASWFEAVDTSGLQAEAGSARANAATPTPAVLSAPRGPGYWMLGADGQVTAFGGVSGSQRVPMAEAIDLEPTPSGAGYWVVDAAGTVVTAGDATHLGDRPSLRAGERVTSLSRTPDGAGYWLFTSLGRAVAYGDAVHHGDLAGIALSGPVLDSVPTPSGQGYYLVGSDGGVFTFGDARFEGSMGATPLNAPVQSLVPDPDGDGYWLVADDGGIFSFGAPFHGSLGGIRLSRPVSAMVALGSGYLMVGADGGVFTFSTPFFGSLGDQVVAAPVVAVAGWAGSATGT